MPSITNATLKRGKAYNIFSSKLIFEITLKKSYVLSFQEGIEGTFKKNQNLFSR